MKLTSIFSSIWFWVALMHIILLSAWYFLIQLSRSGVVAGQ